MLLSEDLHKFIARKAQWMFDIYFGPPGDYVAFVGDGIDDLDALISRLNANAQSNTNRNQRFMIDIGKQYADWVPFDIDDVVAIREQYLQYWGNVAKPNVYNERQGFAFLKPQ